MITIESTLPVIMALEPEGEFKPSAEDAFSRGRAVYVATNSFVSSDPEISHQDTSANLRGNGYVGIIHLIGAH